MKKIALLVLAVVSACAPPLTEQVTILDPELSSLVSPDATIEYLTGKDYSVSEGPVWSASNEGLLFTDVPANKIYLWKENEGVSVFMDPSGYTGFAPVIEKGSKGANGVVYYGNQLILCQHGDRRLAYVASMNGVKPSFRSIVDNYEGKRFNSPNDVVIGRKGDFFFTDPPYGFYDSEKKGFSEERRELSFNGVYQYNSAGKLILISKEMSRPNGIALSLDEKYLYVNNSDPDKPVMMRYAVDDNWASELFFDGSELSRRYEGHFDGMKVHSSGNIFTTAPNGILILSPEGVLRGSINFGKAVTNCAFDPSESYLYVTTFDQVARIKLQP